MRLPSYRSHLLLLNSICMEAVHDYLTMRLEDRPANPSCLTVKQVTVFPACTTAHRSEPC